MSIDISKASLEIPSPETKLPESVAAEHAHISSAISLKRIANYLAEIRTTIAYSDGWIEWKPAGSDGYIIPDGLVEVRFRSGLTALGEASDLTWSHSGSNRDIMAYRTNFTPRPLDPKVLGLDSVRSYAEDATFVGKQTSPEVSALAAKYLAMDDATFAGSQFVRDEMPGSAEDELSELFRDIKTLAASCLAQTETKGT